MANSDDMLTKLSTFGTYQKRNFFFISLAIIFSAAQYGYVFVTRSTKYRCYIDECDNINNTVLPTYNADWLEYAIPLDGNYYSKCERFKSLNTSNANSNSGQCTSETFDSEQIEICDKFVFENGDLTIERDFELTCDKNLWKLTILGTLDELGEVVYLPIFGFLSDHFGRRNVLICTLIMSAIAGTIKSFSVNYIMYATMEFVSACFTSGIYSAGFVLGVELLDSSKRVLGSTIIAMVFPLGEIILGVTAWFAPSWRFMLRVLYIPGLFFFSYFWFMDESLRFLIASGREEKALAVMQRIAKVNKLELPQNIKVNEISAMEGVNANKDLVKSETLIKVFRYPRLLLRILNCALSWISCTFVYFGLTVYSVSLTGNIYVNFIILALIEVPAYIVCYYMLDKFGRRPCLAGPLLLSGLACLSFIFTSEDDTTIRLILPIIGKFASTMAFKTIYIYTAEMFPTTLRHSLLALCSMFGRAGAMAAPQLPLLAAIMPSLPLILFGCLGILAGIFAFFLPETNGYNLPDTIDEAISIGKKVKN